MVGAGINTSICLYSSNRTRFYFPKTFCKYLLISLPVILDLPIPLKSLWSKKNQFPSETSPTETCFMPKGSLSFIEINLPYNLYYCNLEHSVFLYHIFLHSELQGMLQESIRHFFLTWSTTLYLWGFFKSFRYYRVAPTEQRLQCKWVLQFWVHFHPSKMTVSVYTLTPYAALTVFFSLPSKVSF